MAQSTSGEVPAYEVYVRQSADRIFQAASEFFMERGNVHQALRNLARRLDESGIPYAVMGAMALGFHGMARMTVDIAVLLTPEGLAAFKHRYLGLGYVSAFPAAEKTFRDTETGVRIDVITMGEYPGDGKPKPVRFPHPQDASEEIGGIRVIKLERFIEVKLASGMTTARLRDLADVQDLIRELRLTREFAEKLDSSVRSRYLELWSESQGPDAVHGT